MRSDKKQSVRTQVEAVSADGAAPWREPERPSGAGPAVGAQPAVHVGEIAGAAPGGEPLVFVAGGRPIAARTVWMPVAPDWSRCVGLRVALGFVGGDPEQPIVLGLLDAPPAAPAAAVREAPVRRIEGKDELLLECGKARISLRADGRIEIRGGYLISRSSGPNKIKGATVDIN